MAFVNLMPAKTMILSIEVIIKAPMAVVIRLHVLLVKTAPPTTMVEIISSLYPRSDRGYPVPSLIPNYVSC